MFPYREDPPPQLPPPQDATVAILMMLYQWGGQRKRLGWGRSSAQVLQMCFMACSWHAALTSMQVLPAMKSTELGSLVCGRSRTRPLSPYFKLKETIQLCFLILPQIQWNSYSCVFVMSPEKYIAALYLINFPFRRISFTKKVDIKMEWSTPGSLSSSSFGWEHKDKSGIIITAESHNMWLPEICIWNCWTGISFLKKKKKIVKWFWKK